MRKKFYLNLHLKTPQLNTMFSKTCFFQFKTLLGLNFKMSVTKLEFENNAIFLTAYTEEDFYYIASSLNHYKDRILFEHNADNFTITIFPEQIFSLVIR